jgi:cell division septation protein DedD
MADYDDGAYYEVQLNNKQLVFFFMATLAIAVVVFLCGVMVGRGVHDATVAAAQNNIAASTGTRAPRVEPTPVASQPALDYAERLESEQENNSLEPAKAVSSISPETVAANEPRKNSSKAPAPPPKRVVTTVGASEGAFTIQVVALKTEDAAESLLNRLKQKNYRAYLESGEEAGLHRVRVGRFSTRAEAEKVVRKLQDEEKFKPYITQ